MKYIVRLTKRAKKQLDRLQIAMRPRINDALKNLVDYYSEKENIPKPDVKMLKGKYKGLLRLRVGDVRVVFRLEYEQFVIFVIEIVPRKDAYN